VDPALLELEPLELLRRLGGPTLLRVPAGAPDPAWRPRAVAVLQHGDERTGLDAVLRVLRDEPALPYDLHVLVGNVAAAVAPPGFAHRALPGQPDMNRTWRDADDPDGADDAVSVATRAALARLRDLGLGALVDLHNTSGANPFHALVTDPTPERLGLAALFTSTVVVWDQRRATLMEGLADRATCVTVECGRVGPEALAFAIAGLRRYLGAPDPGGLARPDRLELLGRMRRVELAPGVRVRFGGTLDGDVDLVVPLDADRRNGVRQPAGWELGRFRPGAPPPLVALDGDGRDVTADVLAFDGGAVRVVAATTPLMMTRSVVAARSDCLTYLLERIG
jgi:hypothetical protein